MKSPRIINLLFVFVIIPVEGVAELGVSRVIQCDNLLFHFLVTVDDALAPFDFISFVFILLPLLCKLTGIFRKILLDQFRFTSHKQKHGTEGIVLKPKANELIAYWLGHFKTN